VRETRWADLKHGYDGSPHLHPDRTGPHNDTHESGKGIGDRNDRTYESLEFWNGL
jgi:hypothetical protein